MFTRTKAALAATMCLAMSVPALAQNSPLVDGEYVEVTSVTIDDGHGLEYATFLNTTWRAQQDYMKAQGWITSYEILQNVHKRAGEPDLYLIQRARSIPDAAEIARRSDMMRAQMKRDDTQSAAASAERAKYRHVLGTSLLQVLNYAK